MARNYYQVLGVRDGASFDEIKAAYIRNVLLSHPDHGGDARRFREVHEAFAILRDLHQGAGGSPPLGVAVRPTSETIFTSVEPPLPRWPWPLPRPFWFSYKQMSLAVLMLLTLVIATGDRLSTPEPHAGAQAAAASSSACPTGAPQINVTNVQVTSEAGLYDYVVSGVIKNSSTAIVGIEQVGIYLGAYDSAKGPDWLVNGAQLQTSQIQPGQSVTWSAAQDGVSIYTTDATARLQYPAEAGVPAYANWDWPGSDPNCQPQ